MYTFFLFATSIFSRGFSPVCACKSLNTLCLLKHTCLLRSTPTWKSARAREIGISVGTSSLNTITVSGCNPINILMAQKVLPLAGSSNIFPSKRKAMITPDASNLCNEARKSSDFNGAFSIELYVFYFYLFSLSYF